MQQWEAGAPPSAWCCHATAPHPHSRFHTHAAPPSPTRAATGTPPRWPHLDCTANTLAEQLPHFAPAHTLVRSRRTALQGCPVTSRAATSYTHRGLVNTGYGKGWVQMAHGGQIFSLCLEEHIQEKIES